MKRQLNLEQVRQLLNRSAAQLDDTRLSALRQARNQALQRHTEQVRALAVAGHGRSAGSFNPVMLHRFIMRVGAILLAAGLVSGIAYWYKSPVKDNSDVDIAILTGDLPLKVFVD